MLQKPIMLLLSHSATPIQILANPVPSGREIKRTSLQRRQQPGHQAAALGETVDFDVFVERMRIGAAHA